MRKYLFWCFLLCLLASLSCGIAQAADSGICAVKTKESTEVAVLSAQDDGKGAYEGAEKVEVTYSSAQEGKQYLVMAVTEAAITDEGIIPTKSNIVYMDQTDENGAQGNSVSFQVYPKELTTGTYHICMSSNATDESSLHKITEVASFDFCKYGDANGDGIVNVQDINKLIQQIVNGVEMSPGALKAANTNRDEDGIVNVQDINKIISHIVNNTPF